jgi:hypothetical protein
MISLAEDDTALLLDRLNDPVWRVCNLYKVKDAKSGQEVPFVPTPEQRKVLEGIYRRGERRIIILKARQLGMSTLIDIVLEDACIWNDGFQTSIVDQTQGDASLKLRTKVKVAFDGMPAYLKGMFEITADSGKEFSVRLKRDEAKASSVFAGMNARGGTNQMLHISEWGPIQHDDAERSDNIMNGAIPSAKEGVVIVETTWKGGKGGNLWELTERAMTTKPEDMTAADYRLYFFPWYLDPVYSLEGNFDQVPADVIRYFEEMRVKTGHYFTKGQILWYYKEALPKGTKRYEEFPTVIEECFMSPVEGAIYGEKVNEALAQGRITSVPFNKGYPVHTFWDLGSPKNTVCLYVQFIGEWIHFIDCDVGLEMGPAERVAWMREKGYFFAEHFLPHDGDSEGSTGMTFRAMLEDAGLKNVTVLRRPADIWTGINAAGDMFNRCKFDKDNAKRLVDGLSAYRTRIDKKTAHETSVPVHDWASHISDPFRVVAEAMQGGYVKIGAQPPPPKVISALAGLGDDWDGKSGRVISAFDDEDW